MLLIFNPYVRFKKKRAVDESWTHDPILTKDVLYH